ncbi:hypothetical protein GCM10027162_06360 [Streptomyces incanus]
MVGEVHVDGAQRGFHRWNRLPSGVELDLTREQFQRGQTVVAARVVERPPGRLPRRWEGRLLPRERVTEHLGRLPEPLRAGRRRPARLGRPPEARKPGGSDGPFLKTERE